MSVSPFIRAHGYLPGPTERPVAAGVLSGIVACVPALVVAAAGRGLAGVAEWAGFSVWAIRAGSAVFLVTAAALYGRVFMRAANDRRGGWLFGISFGFLLWLIGPLTVAPLFGGEPIVVGPAAQTLFAAHIAFGLTLGVAFPRSHRLVRRLVAPGHHPLKGAQQFAGRPQLWE